MSHESTNGFITIPDGTDIVSRAAYDAVLEQIDAALHSIRAETAYYDITVLAGTHTLADWETSTNAKPAGVLTSPGGGFCFTTERSYSSAGNSHMTKLSIPVKNKTVGNVTISLHIPRHNDYIYAQIDTGTKNQLGASDIETNATADIVIPTGDHTVSFYLAGVNEIEKTFILADWLTADVVYNRSA